MATSKLSLLIELQDKMSNKLTQIQNKFSKNISKMQVKYQSFISGIGADSMLDNLKNPALIMGGVALAVGGFMAKSTTMANDWHKQMAEINVTAELSKNELQGLSDGLLKIGTRNVAPLEEVPKAFQRIISAGLDVNTSLQALEPTIRAAKAGFTDIETVASAGIATMSSSGQDINKVYDILFQTVKAGNAEFKDIAQYLPKVVPLAKGVGFSLEQTAGAFAALTTKLSSEQSSTALEGIIRSLSNVDIAYGKVDSKTGKYLSGFRALGLNIYDQQGKIKPLTNIVGELKKQMDGLTDEKRMKKLSQLGFDQSTAMGFSTLLQDVEGLQKATDATTFSQNALNKAYMDSLTPTEQWGMIQNNIKGVMIKLGEKILPYVTLALDKLSPAFEWLFANIDTIIPVVGAFIGVLAAVATVGFLAMLPISLTALAIAALIGFIVLAIVKYQEWGALLLWFLGPIGRVISALKLIYDHWDSIKKAFTDGGIVEGFKRIGEVLFDVILQPLEQLLNLLSNLPGAIGRAAGEAQTNVHKLRENLVDTKDEVRAKQLQDMQVKGYQSEGEMFAAEQAKKQQSKSLYKAPLDGTKDFSQVIPTNTKGKKKLSSDIEKVTGASKDVKNINIKFENLHKGDNIIQQGGKGMTLQDLEDFYNEMMMRILRNAELS